MGFFDRESLKCVRLVVGDMFYAKAISTKDEVEHDTLTFDADVWYIYHKGLRLILATVPHFTTLNSGVIRARSVYYERCDDMV